MDVAHKLLQAAIAVVAISLTPSASPQDTALTIRQAGKLQPHRPIERDLGPGQADVFTVDVPAGQFMRVVAYQNGVDVTVAIIGPDGKTLVTGDSPNGLFGPEPASIIAPTGGAYQVRVSASEAPSGHYRIELSDLRKPTDADAERIRAEGILPAAIARAADKANWPEAIQKIREAASLWHQLNDPYEEGLCLYELGSLYHNLDEHQKALASEQQAIKLFQAAGDRAGEGGALAEAGVDYWVLGDKRSALESMQKAEPLLRAVGDRSLQASTLTIAAMAYVDLGQPKNAVEALLRALPIFQAAGNRVEESRALHNMAKAYDDLGEKHKALEYYNQSLSIRRALGDKKGQASTLNNMSTLYSEAGKKKTALEYAAQAVALYRELADRSGEAAALLDLGKISSDLSDKRKAVEFDSEALSIFRELGNRASEAHAMNNLGNVFGDLGENRKALDLHNQALVLERALGDRSGEANSLANMGTVYAYRSENQKALDLFEQALRLYRETGNHSGEATNLDNIGYMYSELGDYRKSLEYHNQALAIFHGIHDYAGESKVVNNIGSVHGELGDYRGALQCFEQALAFARELGDRVQEATALNNIGSMYNRLGDRAKSMDYDMQALTILRAVGDKSGEGRQLNNLGTVYGDQGDYRKALEFFIQSIPFSRATGERRNEASTLTNISSMFKLQGNADAAIFFSKQSVNILQSIRRDNRNLAEDLRHSYEKSIESAYRFLAALLVERQRFGEAEEVLNLLKDKEASDFIRRDGVADQLRSATLLDSEKKALARYEQIVGQVVTTGERKAALIAKSDTAPLTPAELEESSRLDQDLAASNTVLLRYLQEEERAFTPGSAVAKRTEEFREAEGIQDALAKLGPDVVAIYTLVVPDKYIAMLVSSGARKVYTTPIKEADLNKKIFDFRQLLQNPGSDPLPLAQELYRVVFPEGLRQDLDAAHIKTIMWSVDGTLRYIPIAALHDGKDYLVRRFRNSLVTPASLTRLTESPAKVWDGIGFGVSEAKATFSALPSVPEELHSIFRQSDRESDKAAAPIAGTIRLNAEFTRSAFEKDLSGRRNRVVHIATHFDSNPGVAANSHLLLGDGTELSLADIEAETRLFNGVDLLTISACSTAFTNRSEDGREIDSFGTIAQRLGAKGVIASLWSVNDLATARLMETMYRLRQQNPGAGKSEALRQAQEQMVTGELRPSGDTGKAGRGTIVAHEAKVRDWSHPYYWAPFILIGNWR